MPKSKGSSETFIQTRVPRNVAAEIAFIAYDEGDTVAAWLRRLVVREVGFVRIKAWVVAAARANPARVFAAGEPAHYALLARRHITPLDRVFLLTDLSGKPVSDRLLLEYEWFKKPHKFRFVLERSPAPWQMLTMIGHEITLHAEVDRSAG
jgi:hypothetical protein